MNAVAADKAPSVNPKFIQNVGTIEVIVLRCRPEEVDPQPQRLLNGAKKADTPKTNQKGKKVTPAKAASSKKSEAWDMLGGLFGLFDGTADLESLGDGDPGARREPVTPQPTQLFYSNVREERLEDLRLPKFIIGSEDQDSILDEVQQWDDKGRYDAEGDKYLGLKAGERKIYKSQMREPDHPTIDWALSAPPKEQAAYKFKDLKFGPHSDDDPPWLQRLQALLHERGHYDQTPEGIELWNADKEEWRKYVEVGLTESPFDVDLQRIIDATNRFAELYRADRKVVFGDEESEQDEELLMDNDSNEVFFEAQESVQSEAALTGGDRDKVLSEDEDSTYQETLPMGNDGNESPKQAQGGPLPVDNLPGFAGYEATMRETLLDIEALRQIIVQLQQQHSELNLAPFLNDFRRKQDQALRNPILLRSFDPNKLSSMIAQREHARMRIDWLKKVYTGIQQWHEGFRSQEIEGRIMYAQQIHDGFAKAAIEFQQAKGMPRALNQVGQTGIDGLAEEYAMPYAARQGNGAPQMRMPQGGQNPGFQQVGQGVWNGGQAVPLQGFYRQPQGNAGGGAQAFQAGNACAAQPQGGAGANTMNQPWHPHYMQQQQQRQHQSPAFGNNQANQGFAGYGASPDAPQNAGGAGWGASPQNQQNVGGGGGGWDDAQKRPSQRTHSHGFGHQGNQNDNNDWGAPGNGSANKNGNGWGGQGGSAQKNGNGWDDKGSNRVNKGWGNGDSKQGQQGANGWGDNNGGNGDGGWGNGNNGGNGSNRDNGGDDWNKGNGQKQQDGGGWGNNDQQQGGGWNDSKKNYNSNGGGNWSNKSSHHSNNGGGWGAASQKNDQKSRSRGGRQPDRSQSEPLIKPYWQDWRIADKQIAASSTNKKHDEPREVYTYPASPLPAVPKDKAKGATHGIQTSRGANYNHRTYTPTYIDGMDQPYAVFSFKYRTKEQLEKILKIKIDGVALKEVETQAEKDKFMNMPKHKLVEKLMAKRTPPKAAPGAAAHSGGQKGGSGWGNQGRGNSNQGSNKGWGDQGGGNGGSNNGWGNQDGGNVGSNNDWNKQGDGTGGSNGWGNQGGDNSGANDGWGNGGGSHKASGGNRKANGAYNFADAKSYASGGKGKSFIQGWDGADESPKAGTPSSPPQEVTPVQVAPQRGMSFEAARKGFGPTQHAQQGFMLPGGPRQTPDPFVIPAHVQAAADIPGIGNVSPGNFMQAWYDNWKAKQVAMENQARSQPAQVAQNVSPNAVAHVGGNQEPLGRYHPAMMAAKKKKKRDVVGVSVASDWNGVESKSTTLPEGFFDKVQRQSPAAQGREKGKKNDVDSVWF